MDFSEKTENTIDTFQRIQLRNIIGINGQRNITNKELERNASHGGKNNSEKTKMARTSDGTAS